MRFGIRDLFYTVLILIISVFFTLDVFITPGRLATMDGDVHATNIEQYFIALSQGDFPVVWTDGFANYGMPIGIIAQPLPNYIGALFNSFVHNPEVSYNLLGFFAVVFAGLSFYLFLRLYFSEDIAFLGVFLLTFSPFRIVDFYIRGDLPEILSSAFLPFILFAVYKVVQKRKIIWLLFVSITTFFLTLTHPMTLVIYSFIYIPYFFFCITVVNGRFMISNIWKSKNIKLIVYFIGALLLGVAMASFYVLPLNLEIKYFVEGSYTHFLTNGFLSFSNFFNFTWYYFTPGEIYTRGHVITVGIIEIGALLLGLVFILYKILVMKNGKKEITLLDFSVVIGLIVLFFTMTYATVFYNHISLLDKILFPWRMMAAFIFLPPLIICYFLQKINNKIVILVLILLVSILRFPQVYGKNYTLHPQNIYVKNTSNLYSVLLNTIWMGKSDDYPVKQNKIDIIGGKGKIISEKVYNSHREYTIDALIPLQLVDYTFYFPGWHVYVDGKDTPIQFQDPNHRGVITYTIPSGKHDVQVVFQDTLVRKLGKIVSVMFIVITFGMFVLRKQLQKLLFV